MILGRAITPTPDEGRSLLRRELVKPAYRERDLVDQIIEWFERIFRSGLSAASDVPFLATALAIVLLVALLIGVGMLTGRARRTARASRREEPLFLDPAPSAAALRAAAEVSRREGRLDDALLDAYRALARRQVEDGHIDDRPGATAHDLATALGTAWPGHLALITASAAAFDQVCYGGRHATAQQVEDLLTLDDAIAAVRGRA